ncbi:hypothetical protein KI387_041499, partial [Taxus chinensis]
GSKNGQAKSAPVNVPDWTKIWASHNVNSSNVYVGDDDDVDEEERLPPHDYLARRQAEATWTPRRSWRRRRKESKGRDMSGFETTGWIRRLLAEKKHNCVPNESD